MFEKELAFFKANQTDLVREHNGRALGVSNVSMAVYQAYGELASLFIGPQPPATPEGPAGTPEWIRLPTKRSRGRVNYEHRP